VSFLSEGDIRAINEFGVRIGEALSRDLTRFARAAQPLVDAVWSAYRRAGAPYGDEEEGMLRWVSERRQMADLRAQAERIESIHETCAQLRRTVKR
jgi:hypothetical protein